jgi:lipid II:glycine glycyltransferase (peptidoglycan interpeptide bridge formation enzyme)
LDQEWSKLYEDLGFVADVTYFLHILDLEPELGAIFSRLDKDSVQRRVQRAQRAALSEKCGRSDILLRDFYALFVLTRARHSLPPMPMSWFLNLVESLGEALEIRLAYKDDIPISGILTLRFKDVVIYKYGCSNLKYNKYGATPWLLWRAIEAAKSAGAKSFDLGRTDQDNAGLNAFKNHWVPQPVQMVYWKFPPQPFRESMGGWKLKAAKRVFSFMPNSLLRMAGKLIYRHIG